MMTSGDDLFYALLAALGSMAGTAGYLLGLRRFAARSRDELAAAQDALAEAKAAREAADRDLQAAKTAAERDLQAAKATAERSLQDVQRASDKLADAKTAAERALADAKDAASKQGELRAPTVTHTVLLDGVSNSGKSTLVHRLAFPCTEPDSLRKITATQLAYRTRLLPICFVPPIASIREVARDVSRDASRDGDGDRDAGEAPVLHAQVLRDIAGEKPYEIINILKQLSAERELPSERDRHGTAIVVLVWDMADTAGCRARITRERLQVAYHNDYARQLIKHFVIFFNKLDLLLVPPERVQQLVDDERAHLASITDFLGTDVARTYLQGSALRGDGVIECQGAIYTALGLAPHFRDLDKDGNKDGKQP
jgi:F0F1-type ATP synthase membrane subunit b/b'